MIVVTSTARNAVGYASRCVASVRVQQYPSHHLYTAADAATAAEAQAAADPSTRRPFQAAWIFEHDCPCLENLVRMWQGLPPSDVVVWLDGDDELTPGALERVAHYYQRSDVWLTYGSFIRDDGVKDCDWNPCFGRRYARAPRAERWRAGHLRTFRAGLVQKLIAEPAHLKTAGGSWFDVCCDVSVMLPLLELAGPNYLAVTDVNAVYNYAHSLDASDPKGAKERERRVLDELARRTPLEPLAERPW